MTTSTRQSNHYHQHYHQHANQRHSRQSRKRYPQCQNKRHIKPKRPFSTNMSILNIEDLSKLINDEAALSRDDNSSDHPSLNASRTPSTASNPTQKQKLRLHISIRGQRGCIDAPTSLQTLLDKLQERDKNCAILPLDPTSNLSAITDGKCLFINSRELNKYFINTSKTGIMQPQGTKTY